MLSKQEEQFERRATLDNDRKVREGSAYIDHYTQEMGGRFAQVGAATVIGSTAPQYPQASTPFQRDPVPPEEPLGYEIDRMPEPEPLAPSSFSRGQLGEPMSADAPSTMPVQVQRADVGSPTFKRRV
jgi:hypothetical protein